MELQSLDVTGKSNRKVPLLKTPEMEVAQFIIPAGGAIPTYEAQGEIILHCVGGRVVVSFDQVEHTLSAGQLLYLSVRAPFSIVALETASLISTIVAVNEEEG